MSTSKYLEDLTHNARTEFRRWFCAELERGCPVNEIEESAEMEKIDEIINESLPAYSALGKFFADNADTLGWVKPEAWASSIFDALEYAIHDIILADLKPELKSCLASVTREAEYYTHDEPEEAARQWLRDHVGYSEEAQRNACRAIGRELASDPVGASYLTYRAMMA